jgi:O-antigen/teichoic acid export membrane protein
MIAGVLVIGLNLALVPIYGIEGAAWVTSGTYAILLGINMVGQIVVAQPLRFRSDGQGT